MSQTDQFHVASRLTPLEPGMYIFRYASVVSDDQIIQLALQGSPIGKGQVDFFPGEGVVRNTLVRLGDCVIVRVKGSTAGILITEYRSLNATQMVDLRLDRIDTSANIVRQADTAGTGEKTPKLSPVVVSEQLALSGYIERSGEVRAPVGASDSWLGDPASTLRLEAFSIDWNDKPKGVELVYTCQVQEIGQLPPSITGQPTGTRGKNLPIFTISLLLAGPRADEYELSGQVAFSGQPPQALLPGSALTGPTGQEHLVALRPRIAAKPAFHATRATRPVSAQHAPVAQPLSA